MLNEIIKFFQRIWEWLKSLFGSKPQKPLVRITILMLLLLLNIPALSQRPNLAYVNVFFHHDALNTDAYTVRWLDGSNDSLTVALTDTNLFIWQNGWVNYQSGMTVDSVKIIVNRTIEYNTEYDFDVVAKGSSNTVSDPTKVFFIRTDINNDKAVDGLDLIKLSLKWGRSGLGYRDFEDINGDGYTDGLDLIQLGLEWGRTWTP